MKPTIYLAGPVQHADDHGVGWRETVDDLVTSFETADPLDKYNVAVDDLDVVPYAAGEGEISYADIVHGDKQLIDDSDALLVGFSDVQSVGTPMEVMYAFPTAKPIVLWIRDETDPESLSPWWHYHVDAVEDNLTSALWQLRQRTDVEVDL